MAFCTKCGAQISDGAAFCTSCGQAISSNGEKQMNLDEIKQYLTEKNYDAVLITRNNHFLGQDAERDEYLSSF